MMTVMAEALPQQARHSLPPGHRTLFPAPEVGGICRPGALPRRPVSLSKNKPHRCTASRESRQEGTRHVSQGLGTDAHGSRGSRHCRDSPSQTVDLTAHTQKPDKENRSQGSPRHPPPSTRKAERRLNITLLLGKAREGFDLGAESRFQFSNQLKR